MSDYDERILDTLLDSPYAWLSSRQIAEKTCIGDKQQLVSRQKVIIRKLTTLTKFGFLECKEVDGKRYWRLADV